MSVESVIEEYWSENEQKHLRVHPGTFGWSTKCHLPLSFRRAEKKIEGELQATLWLKSQPRLYAIRAFPTSYIEPQLPRLSRQAPSQT